MQKNIHSKIGPEKIVNQKLKNKKAESLEDEECEKHPIQKRSRKDSMKLLQSNNGNLIILWIVSIYFCVGKLLSHEAK
jgi:hypothetical protein